MADLANWDLLQGIISSNKQITSRIDAATHNQKIIHSLNENDLSSIAAHREDRPSI